MDDYNVSVPSATELAKIARSTLANRIPGDQTVAHAESIVSRRNGAARQGG